MQTFIGDGANFSRDRCYRYHLWRTWDASCNRRAVFIGLNPSQADAHSNDATVRRCVDFAKRWRGQWRVGGFSLINLYAYCTAEPIRLFAAGDPVGQSNARWIKQICNPAEKPLLLAMWGNHGERDGRAQRFLQQQSKSCQPVFCLRINKSGQPAHPLYLPGGLNPIPYQ